MGAALALEGSGRLPVAVLGDGDFLMGGTAVWTAAHYRLPLLIVVANNSFFYNDVVHQGRIAGQRQRPARNSWIGQAISDPDPDLPAFARSLGFHAADQVRDRSALSAALAAAASVARSGQCVLVDVRVRPDGYALMREITVGVVAPAYVNVPLWVAQERGFLERRGLRAAERILGTTHGVTNALRHGEVDIALTAPEGSIADAVAGGPLRVVAGLIDRPPLSMIAIPRHRRFSDLRGGRIGTSSLTEGTRHVAERMLAAHGLTYPADYDFALEGSHVERWKALQAGTIDAALQMIPYDDIATDAGFTNLGPVTEEFALNAVCARFPAERAVLTAFLQALAEAAEWFRGNIGESATIAAARTSIEPRYALRACQALAAGGVIPRDLRSGPGALAAAVGALRSSGLIPTTLLSGAGPDPIAAAVDYSYL